MSGLVSRTMRKATRDVGFVQLKPTTLPADMRASLLPYPLNRSFTTPRRHIAAQIQRKSPSVVNTDLQPTSSHETDSDLVLGLQQCHASEAPPLALPTPPRRHSLFGEHCWDSVPQPDTTVAPPRTSDLPLFFLAEPASTPATTLAATSTSTQAPTPVSTPTNSPILGEVAVPTSPWYLRMNFDVTVFFAMFMSMLQSAFTSAKHRGRALAPCLRVVFWTTYGFAAFIRFLDLVRFIFRNGLLVLVILVALRLVVFPPLSVKHGIGLIQGYAHHLLDRSLGALRTSQCLFVDTVAAGKHLLLNAASRAGSSLLCLASSVKEHVIDTTSLGQRQFLTAYTVAKTFLANAVHAIAFFAVRFSVVAVPILIDVLLEVTRLLVILAYAMAPLLRDALVLVLALSFLAAEHLLVVAAEASRRLLIDAADMSNHAVITTRTIWSSLPSVYSRGFLSGLGNILGFFSRSSTSLEGILYVPGFDIPATFEDYGAVRLPSTDAEVRRALAEMDAAIAAMRRLSEAHVKTHPATSIPQALVLYDPQFVAAAHADTSESDSDAVDAETHEHLEETSLQDTQGIRAHAPLAIEWYSSSISDEVPDLEHIEHGSFASISSFFSEAESVAQDQDIALLEEISCCSDSISANTAECESSHTEFQNANYDSVIPSHADDLESTSCSLVSARDLPVADVVSEHAEPQCTSLSVTYDLSDRDVDAKAITSPSSSREALADDDDTLVANTSAEVRLDYKEMRPSIHEKDEDTAAGEELDVQITTANDLTAPASAHLLESPTDSELWNANYGSSEDDVASLEKSQPVLENLSGLNESCVPDHANNAVAGSSSSISDLNEANVPDESDEDAEDAEDDEDDEDDEDEDNRSPNVEHVRDLWKKYGLNRKVEDEPEWSHYSTRARWHKKLQKELAGKGLKLKSRSRFKKDVDAARESGSLEMVLRVEPLPEHSADPPNETPSTARRARKPLWRYWRYRRHV